MFEEHQENQFEESQVMRSYSAGIIDGLALALTTLSDTPLKDAPAFPLSISFYEEDEPPVRYPSYEAVERLRERVFDLQHNKPVSLFYEEVD
jgi:hypothetical protein